MIYLTLQRWKLTARTSLIPRVIPFGHKLVKKKSQRVDDFQTYTKNYEISSLTPPFLTLLVPTPKPERFQTAGCKSRGGCSEESPNPDQREEADGTFCGY